MTLYNVFTTDYEFVMTAPLAVLLRVFAFAPAALQRIETETKDGGRCHLHFNGRPTCLGPSVSSIFVVTA